MANEASKFTMADGTDVSIVDSRIGDLTTTGITGSTVAAQLKELNSKRIYFQNIAGAGVLEVSGHICILQFTNTLYDPNGNYVPNGYRPAFSNGAWAAVSSQSDPNAGFRIQVQNTGKVVVQKNNVSLSDATNLRGQIAWII